MRYIKSIVALVIVAVLGFFGYEYVQDSKLNSQNALIKKQAAEAAKADVGTNYKDGTYTAQGSYQSPGGLDTLTIKVELANNIIKGVEFTGGANDQTSKRWQDTFAKGFESEVVGKNIAGVNLDNVNGSSLTPIGFNDALAKIKLQAKS